ncbi:TrlF family AAA-like ATPase [Butyrivibrio sp. FCS006]|uniref:TrlF family AAA-like ATPase n=1 Tax=Butyrivibrio sp. FCS006 TaxID=1280684 RepID=UPI00042A165B|nr:hypothetical protein [Butyrivibrio sp. FCS006]
MNENRGSQWRKWDLHIHTASSYDATYKGNDANKLLCDALRDNGIAAAVITDHFIIDDQRIADLRNLAKDIVFFPGVELRTDKGSSNIHVILIFSDEQDLKTLAEDFNAIMLRSKAKAKESDEKVYWDYSDIVEFARDHDALISIHAGKKSNGIDKEIDNGNLFKQAIKEEFAESVDFFEIGNAKKDIESYHKYVFSEIKEKPLVMGSDCHNPKEYTPKEFCWIKADLTFEGLKQCVIQPAERVFIGSVPPAVDRAQKNKMAIIDQLSVRRIDNPKNDKANWLNFDIPLNSSMVAIIGNKGSGKSAFSDIVGHLCKARTMDRASFLTTTRFRKQPKNYAADYEGTIVWADGERVTLSLAEDNYDTVIESAQYLPQKFIEEVCNDIDSFFQEEIDKVIFSYVDKAERGSASSLSDLVKQKAHALDMEAEGIKTEISEVNNRIIELERKSTSNYKKMVEDSLKQKQDLLNRLEKTKPEEVQKPVGKDGDKEYQAALVKVNGTIESINSEIKQCSDRLTSINIECNEINELLAKIKMISDDVENLNATIESFGRKYSVSLEKAHFSSPSEVVKQLRESLLLEKSTIQEKLDGVGDTDGLKKQLIHAQEEKEKLISTTTAEEKRYQKYLSDLEEWVNEKKNVIGDKETEGSLEYYKKESLYINNSLKDEYENAKNARESLFFDLYAQKEKMVGILQEIYSPIQHEIEELLGEIEDNIEFQAEIRLTDNDFSSKILQNINSRMSGVFRGKTEAAATLDKYIKQTEFDKPESVFSLVTNVLQAVEEDIDASEKKVQNKSELYDYLFGLEYADVLFKLKMAGRDLEELSPGERGIVLLVFYLALSKNNSPIIIDQPEDNLDNQSVYSKLVPCICKAKQRRQVIIVTHNPNIAIACDAEQIIFCEMDKDNYQHIRYSTGAIENTEIKKHVVDVLEGTMPAFNLRRQKYIWNEE